MHAFDGACSLVMQKVDAAWSAVELSNCSVTFLLVAQCRRNGPVEYNGLWSAVLVAARRINGLSQKKKEN